MKCSKFEVYELDSWSQNLSAGFTLKYCFLKVVKLTKNDDWDNYSYSWYGVAFDSRSLFLLPNLDFGKNAITLGVGNTSSLDIDNTKKYNLVLDKVKDLKKATRISR